jgi:hypothetical protein
VKFKPQLGGKIANELLIEIGFGSADSMMEVRDRKNNPQLVSQVEQDSQQSHGIGAAGDGNRHPLSGPEQPVPVDVFVYLLLHSLILTPFSFAIRRAYSLKGGCTAKLLYFLA